jgi:hypothetical protein
MLNILKNVNIREQITNLIKQMNEPIICEVGVHKADNFKLLLCDNVKIAFGIDIWKNTENIGENDNLVSQQELDTMYENVKKEFINDNRVKFIREFSTTASKQFEDEYFDFIYIDADHQYDAVLKDLRAWYPKLKKGGIIGGHDYIDGDLTLKLGHVVRFGVVDAVADFRKEQNIKDENFHLTREMYASYYFIKE